MLDDDDVTFFALLAPTPKSVLGCLALVAVLVVLIVVVLSNETDCSEQKCDRGVAELHDGSCMCVEKPRP
jgi:hypothetical protein